MWKNGVRLPTRSLSVVEDLGGAISLGVGVNGNSLKAETTTPIGTAATSEAASLEGTCRNSNDMTGKSLATEILADSIVELIRSETRQNPPGFPAAAVEPPSDTHSAVLSKEEGNSNSPLFANFTCRNCILDAGKLLAKVMSAESMGDSTRSEIRQNPLALSIAAIEPSTEMHSAPIGAPAPGDESDSARGLASSNVTCKNCRSDTATSWATEKFVKPAVDVLRSEAKQNPPADPVAADEPPIDTHSVFVLEEALAPLSANSICTYCKPTAGIPLATARFAKIAVDLLRSEARQNPSAFSGAEVDPPADKHSAPIDALPPRVLPSLKITCRNCMPTTAGSSLATEKFAEFAMEALRSAVRQNPPKSSLDAAEPLLVIHSAPSL